MTRKMNHERPGLINKDNYCRDGKHSVKEPAIWSSPTKQRQIDAAANAHAHADMRGNRGKLKTRADTLLRKF